MADQSDQSEHQPASTGLEAMLCFDLYAASRAMTATYRPVLAEHGLTYPQYLVLVALWAHDDVAIKHLATTLRLDHATLTPLLRRLEERGLLERAPGDVDRRSVRVRLSAAGDEMRRIVDDVHGAIVAATGLDHAALDRLQSTLRSLTTSLLTAPGPGGPGAAPRPRDPLRTASSARRAPGS